jgi:quercetin dioxygenase-like cupin family protein
MELVNWEEAPIEWMSDTLGRQLIHTETMTLARVTLLQGGSVPVHEHENEQITTVLEGRVRLVVGGEEREVEPGTTVLLPANVPHEVEALADTVLFDVFSPRREDWITGDDAYLRR